MTKSELIREVADNLGFTKKDVKAVLENLEETVYTHMKDDKVSLFNGLTLSSVYKEPREGRNPRTGEPIAIDGKYVPRARFGNKAKTVLN